PLDRRPHGLGHPDAAVQRVVGVGRGEAPRVRGAHDVVGGVGGDGGGPLGRGPDRLGRARPPVQGVVGGGRGAAEGGRRGGGVGGAGGGGGGGAVVVRFVGYGGGPGAGRPDPLGNPDPPVEGVVGVAGHLAERVSGGGDVADRVVDHRARPLLRQPERVDSG